MAFEAYLPRRFDHAHENASFDALVNRLHAVLAPAPGRHVLIGNVLCSGNEMDAVLLKPDGIVIIEMKDHGGIVEFSENSPWKADGREVKGGTKQNPFIQVRACRIALRTWLETLSRNLELHPRQREHWSEISAVILFSRGITFDDRALIGAVRYWFSVTDMNRAASCLKAVKSRSLRFDSDEMNSILRQMGVNDAHIHGSVPSAAPPTAPDIQSAALPAVFQLNYVKEFNYRDHDLRMHRLGGAQSQGAEQVRQWIEQVRQGVNPFKEIPKRHDERLRGATIYTVNHRCELVLIELGAFAIPGFIGEPNEVEGWIRSHKDLMVTIDEKSGRVSTTRVAESPTAELQPPSITAENTPYLLRVTGLELDALVPQELARQHLLALDETSSEQEIRNSLELVFSPDVRGFLFDVIDLVRGGNIARADARIVFRKGESVPAEDAGAFANEAAAANANSDQILVINALTKEQLDQLLDPVNFKDWMLFLHPDQQALVEAEFAKPLVLKGVSGSGKTCIVVHRARHLTKLYPGERIGILTLSESLAGLLQNLVNRLCSDEERSQIIVVPFYEVFRDCLKALGPHKYFTQLAAQVEESSHMHTVLKQAAANWPNRMVWKLDPVSKVTVEQEWDDFYMQKNPDALDWMRGLVKYLESLNVDAARYIEEEFTLIRSAFTVPDRAERYYDFDRSGRTIRFTKELRQDALRLLLFWEEWLLNGGMIDALGLTQALMPLHAEMQKLPANLRFRSLLVDEFQDFSSLDLQLLRRMVPLDKPNALFLAGDPVQKILVKRLRYAEAALDEGSAIHKKIWKNYRNSKQILRAACRVANHFGKVAGAQGEEIEVLDPELAQRETNPPIAVSTTNQIEKAWEITLECMQRDCAEPWTVCIATASPQTVSVASILQQRPAQLQARAISGDCILHPEEVVIGTIADLKGFEFRLVLIIGCDAQSLPYAGIPADEVWREALRLYVAMTRGRDQLFLIYEGEPSRFLTVMDDAVVLRDEPAIKAYEKIAAPSDPPPSAQPIAPAVAAHVAVFANLAQQLDPDGRCETWFSEIELKELHKYFARHVYRDGLTFREWLRPEALKFIKPNLFYKVPRCTGTIVHAVICKLRDHGIHLKSGDEKFREGRHAMLRNRGPVN